MRLIMNNSLIKKTFKTLLCFLICSCSVIEEKKFKGEFNYTKEEKEMAKNKFGVEFKKHLYETKDKQKLYYVGGSIYHNYDYFNKSYHINGFGQLGMEF